MNEDTKPKEMRIHIGGISKQLASDPESLQSRLLKFGKLLSPLEVHQKSSNDDHLYFGYVTLELTASQFGQLKSTYNGTKFKGSVLTISEGKPDWKQRWAADQARPDPPLNSDQAVRKFETANREIDVLPGRMRKSARAKTKQMTIRVFVGKRRKILTCPRKKLWGFMKERKLEHLVAGYSHGKWVDYNGDIVETVDMLVLPAVKKVKSVVAAADSKKAELSKKGNNEVNDVDDDEEDEEAREERERNLNILRSMFGLEAAAAADDPFPQPVNLDESEESDWENLTAKATKITTEADFADDYREVRDHFSKKNKSERKLEPESEAEQEQQQKEDEAVTNSTSTLRKLFNPTEETTPFSLFGGDHHQAEGGDYDDGDVDIEMIDPIETPVLIIEPPKPKATTTTTTTTISNSSSNTNTHNNNARIYATTNKGLFFPHFESPFLSSQSQIESLAKFSLDKEAWQKEFYDMRGEWNRTLRRRRRDVVRQIHKKNQAKRRTVAI